MGVRPWVVLGLLSAAVATADEPAPSKTPSVVERLNRGEWSAAEQQARRRLSERPEDDEARLQLGFTLTLRAIERFTAFQWEYGGRFERVLVFVPAGGIPRENPTPNRVSYVVWRRSLETLLRDLEQAEAMLAGVKDERARLRIEFTKLQWDPDGDGKPQPLLPNGAPLPRELKEANPNIEIAFDATDAIWLRGYCRLLSGSLNFFLSLDLSELFYHAAKDVYCDPIVPEQYAKLTEPERSDRLWQALTNLKFAEPDRLHAARLHWIRVTELSDAMWKSAEGEIDNDREWIPNPRQTGALPFKVTAEMITSWSAAMQESRALLEGRKLLRPWVFLGRNQEAEKGVNLRRLLDDPPRKPLIQWILQSPPEYLEEGEISDEAVFQRLNTVFGPNVFWFGMWVN